MNRTLELLILACSVDSLGTKMITLDPSAARHILLDLDSLTRRIQCRRRRCLVDKYRIEMR